MFAIQGIIEKIFRQTFLKIDNSLPEKNLTISFPAVLTNTKQVCRKT